MGLGIIIYFLMQFVYDYSLQYLFHSITIQNTSIFDNYINGILMLFVADYHFPFEGIIVGSLLVIFSTLIQQSSQIEKNWSLTI